MLQSTPPKGDTVDLMARPTRNVITLVLPEIDAVVEAMPDALVEERSELRARVRLAYLTTHVSADAGDLERAIDVLGARAAGEAAVDPFGARVDAQTYDDLVDAAERALADDRLDLATVLALQHESGAIAARHGRRLILFLGVNAEARRLMWDLGTAELERRGEPPERFEELGRWLLLWSEMSSMAIGEGYRATERELLARDVAARRAALDELLGAVAVDARSGARLRRLAMRYGLDPDATFRVAAILPGLEADPTPDDPGIDDEDLDALARRIDHLIRRQGSRDGPGSGITAPLAISWRGSVVAILSADPPGVGAPAGGGPRRCSVRPRRGRPSRCAPTGSAPGHGRWSSCRKACASPRPSVATGSSTTSPSSASSGCC